MRSIFVSSTFQDMQNERDLLQSYITPLINEKIKKYQEEVNLVDLRWGVNTENLDSNEGAKKVLEVCFNEIKKCKPYMIILIGERYGWIPSLELIEETTNKYQLNIEDRVSVTELEIQFGAFLQNNMDNCIFCFRENENSLIQEDTYHKEKLEKLKKKILDKNPRHILYYNESNIEKNFQNEIVRIVADDIEKKYINKKILSWQENTLKNNEYTLKKHLDYFIERKELTDNFKYLITNTNNYLYVITGESGLGKTAMMAKLYDDFSKIENKDCFLFILENDFKSQNNLDFYNQINYYLTNLLKVEYLEYKNSNDARKKYFSLIDLYNQKFNNKHELFIFIDIPKYDSNYLDSNIDDFSEFSFAFPLKNQKIITTSRESCFSIIHEYKELKLEKLNDHEIEEITKIIAKKYNKELSISTIEKIKIYCKQNPELINLIIKRLVLLNKNDYNEIRKLGDGILVINKYLTELIEKMPSNKEDIYDSLIHLAIESNNKNIEYAIKLISLSGYGIKRSTLFNILNDLNKNISSLDLSRLIYYLDGIFIDSISDRIKMIDDLRSKYNNDIKIRDYYYNYIYSQDSYTEIDIKEICNMINDFSDFHLRYIKFYCKNQVIDDKRLIILSYLLKSLKLHDFDLDKEFNNYVNDICNYLLNNNTYLEKFILDLREVQINQNKVNERILQIIKSKIMEKRDMFSNTSLINILKNINFSEVNLNLHSTNFYNDEYLLTFIKENNINISNLKEFGSIFLKEYKYDQELGDNIALLWEDIYKNDKSEANKNMLIDVYKEIEYSSTFDIPKKLKELEVNKIKDKNINKESRLERIKKLEKTYENEEEITNLCIECGKDYLKRNLAKALEFFNKAYHYAIIYEIKNRDYFFKENTIKEIFTIEFNNFYKERKYLFFKQLEIFDKDTKNSNIDIQIDSYQKFSQYFLGEELIFLEEKILSIVKDLKDEEKYRIIYIESYLKIASMLSHIEKEERALEIYKNLYSYLKSLNLFDMNKIIEKYYLEDLEIPNKKYIDYYLEIISNYEKLSYKLYEIDLNLKIELYKEYILFYLLKYNNRYDAGNIIFKDSSYLKYIKKDIIYPMVEKLLSKGEFYYLENILKRYHEKEFLDKEDFKLIDEFEIKKKKYLEKELEEEIKLLKNENLLDLLKKIYLLIPIYRFFTKELLAISIFIEHEFDGIKSLKQEINDIEIILNIFVKTKKIIKERNGIYLNNFDNIYYKIKKENNLDYDLLKINNQEIISYGYYDYHKNINDIINLIQFIIDNKEVSNYILKNKFPTLNINKCLESYLENDLIFYSDGKYRFSLGIYLEEDIFPKFYYNKKEKTYSICKYRKLKPRVLKISLKKDINKENDFISSLKIYFLEKKIEGSLEDNFIKYLKLREICLRNKEDINIMESIQNKIIEGNLELSKIFYRLLINDSFNTYLNGKEYDYPNNSNLIFKYIIEIHNNKITNINDLSIYDDKINQILEDFHNHYIEYIKDDIIEYKNKYDNISLNDIKKNFCLEDFEIGKLKEILEN